MDLNRVKFGLWHNVLPKVIFPFAGDNEWINIQRLQVQAKEIVRTYNIIFIVT